MEPDFLRQLEYYGVVPGSQATDQSDNIKTAEAPPVVTSSQEQQQQQQQQQHPQQRPPPLWDAPASPPLPTDAATLSAPSTAGISTSCLSQESLLIPPSTASTAFSFASSSQQLPPYLASRRILPTRLPQRSREGNERKRSKLTSDVTSPLDSVDYWMQFDGEEHSETQALEGLESAQPDTPASDSKPRSKRPLGSPGNKESNSRMGPSSRSGSLRHGSYASGGGGGGGGGAGQLGGDALVGGGGMGGGMGSGMSSGIGSGMGSGMGGVGNVPGMVGGGPIVEEMDDSALDNALSPDVGRPNGNDDDDLDDEDMNLNLAEQLSKYDTAPPSDVPQREGLYSTPLSWERPQAGLRVDPLLGLQTTAPGQLTPQEQARLISIALGTGSMTGGLGVGATGAASSSYATGSGVPTLGAANFAASFPYAAAALGHPYGTTASSNPYGTIFGNTGGYAGQPSYASSSSAYGMAQPQSLNHMMNFGRQPQPTPPQQQQQQQPPHSQPPPQQPLPPSLEDLLEQTRPRPMPPEQPSRKPSSTYVKSERDEDMERHAGSTSSRTATAEPSQRNQESTGKGKGKEETPQSATVSTSGTGGGTGTGGERSGSGGGHSGHSGPRADRAAHNDIERKYRTNLKDRIAELRDAVPSLRTIREGEALGDDDDELGGGGSKGGGSGPKVSKGTILTKAVEYIHQLERRNRTILREHQELARRLQAFEQLFAATARPAAFVMPNYSRTLFDPRAFC